MDGWCLAAHAHTSVNAITFITDAVDEPTLCSLSCSTTCASSSLQCPDCMAGPVITKQSPSSPSSSSQFAAQTLSPALETTLMNLFVVKTSIDNFVFVQKAAEGLKAQLHVPAELECTPLLADLLFAHMLSPQYELAFRYNPPPLPQPQSSTTVPPPSSHLTHSPPLSPPQRCPRLRRVRLPPSPLPPRHNRRHRKHHHVPHAPVSVS
jgi:hypothetical protein